MFSGLRSLLGFATTDENEPTTTTSGNVGQEGENLVSVADNDVINQLTLSNLNLCTKSINEIQAIEVGLWNGSNDVKLDISSVSGRSLRSSISNGSLQISADASRLLNSATTKFTEQLIVPPRRTIEQLQASSHQMLPDLGEMEETASKISGSPLTTDQVVRETSTKTNNMISLENTTKQDDVEVDDDNCSIDESWELLDMDGDQKCTKELKAKCEAIAETREKENNKNNNNHIDGDDIINLDKYETVQIEGKARGKSTLPMEENMLDSFVLTDHSDVKQTNDDDSLIDVIDGKVISLDAVSIDDCSLTPESGDSSLSPLRANKVGKKNQRNKKKKKNKANAKINLCDLVSQSDVSSNSDEKLNIENMTISVMSETNSVLLEPDWNLPKLHDWSIATTSSTKSKPIDPKVSFGPSTAKPKKNSTQGKTEPKDIKKNVEKHVEEVIESEAEETTRYYTGQRIVKGNAMTGCIDPSKEPKTVREYLQVDDAKPKAKSPNPKLNNNPSPKHENTEVEHVTQAHTPTMQQCNSSSDLQDVDSTSDWAVMDESWYVTPPPCFTGSKAKTSPSLLVKPNARENDLIEHPSIYMSRTAFSPTSLSNNGARKVASANSKKNKKNNKSTENDESFHWVNRKSYFGLDDLEHDETETSILDVDDPLEPPFSEPVNRIPMRTITHTNKRRRDRKQAKRVATESTSSSSGDDKEFKYSKMSRHQWPLQVCKTFRFNGDPDVFDDDESEYEAFQAVKIITDEPMTVSPSTLNLTDMEVYKFSSDVSSLDLVEEAPIVAKREPYVASPIEPERVPGWRLKRQRVNRKKTSKRPLKREPVKTDETVALTRRTHRQESAAMAMINRLGSSIFSNLTNLTTDLRTAVATAAVNSAPAVNPSAAEQQSSPGRTQVTDVLGVNEKLVAIQRKAEIRRQGANSGRNQLNRQNECAKKGNSNRRLGRKTKMAQCQNGVSMNRKVQTNFH